MDPTEFLPEPGLVATGAIVVSVAVALWAGASLVRGSLLRPLEAVMFALVFALVYFGMLSLLDGGSDTETGEESS